MYIIHTYHILGAVYDAFKEGITVHPEIMLPLVCSDHEIEMIAPVVKVRIQYNRIE